MPKKKTPAKVKNAAGLIAETPPIQVANGLAEAILGAPGTARRGVQLSQIDTLEKNLRIYLVSNMRSILAHAYMEHGLIQAIVNVPVDDGLRGGVEVSSKQLDPDQLEELQVEIEREGLCANVFGLAAKWNRLFGGAGVIILTDQKPDTPLDLAAIGPDSRLEFRAVDMWELFHDQMNTEGANVNGRFGEPEYYQYYAVRLHKSRVISLKGLTAPSFVRPRLRGWGFSVVEHLVRSINQYLKSNELTFEVLDEFKLDIFKIKNLTQTLLQPSGAEQVQKRIALANHQKNYQNALTMDGEDDYVQKQLSFAGISEMMQEFRIQVASDMRMPLTKLFGLSAQGFSSGEDDIENYNATVESEVRGRIKPMILRVLEIKCQQKFGFVPKDLQINFKPLRILSSEQEQNVKTSKLSRVISALQAGIITLKEAQESVNKDDLLPVKVEVTEDVRVAVRGAGGPNPEEADVSAPKAPKPPREPREPEPPQ